MVLPEKLAIYFYSSLERLGGKPVRKLATAALSFSAAVFLCRYCIPEHDWLFAALFMALPILSAFFLRGNAKFVFLIGGIAAACGFLWCLGYNLLFFQPAQVYDGQTEAVEAVTADFPELTEYGYRVTVDLTPKTGMKIKTYVYAQGKPPQDLKPGAMLRFTARFRLATIRQGEQTDLYTSKGCFLLATAKAPLQIVGVSGTLPYLPRYLAKSLVDEIRSVFPGDVTAMMEALLIGETDRLTQDQALVNAMTTSGVYHIVSVSGLHVAFLIGLIGVLIRRKKLAALISIPLLLLFMAGGGLFASDCPRGRHADLCSHRPAMQA